MAQAISHSASRGRGLRRLGYRRHRRPSLVVRRRAGHWFPAAGPPASGGTALLSRGTDLRDIRLRGGAEGHRLAGSRRRAPTVSYTIAALLGLVGAVGLDVGVLRTRLVLSRIFWATYPIIFGFQLLFNGLLTGLGVVRYNSDAILGVRLANAPVEDLIFGFALVLATLSVWVWHEPRRSR